MLPKHNSGGIKIRLIKDMKYIQKKQIRTAEHENFPELWNICENAFPLCERRVLQQQIEILDNSSYRLEAWIENDRVIGFIGWWDFDLFRYVEHYAINPEYRARGYGSKFLRKWLNESTKKVVLEIEPVVDETTYKRLKFYKKLSFVENNYKHIQPPYHKNGESMPYKILSYPGKIQPGLYNSFVTKQRLEVMPKNWMAKNNRIDRKRPFATQTGELPVFSELPE